MPKNHKKSKESSTVSREESKSTGGPSKVTIDLLDEDKPLAGQKFCCVSFVSPETILKRKEHFFFEKFVSTWEYRTVIQKTSDFLHFLSYKHSMNFDDLVSDFENFVEEEKPSLLATNITTEFQTYFDNKEEELEEEFSKLHGFQTNVRGVKCRGNFGTEEAARFHAKMLQESDPYHDVFVGQVGVWMPWEPIAYKTGNVEYLNEELNTLMAEKIKNEKHAKQEFDKRVMESKRKAIEENISKAQKSGSSLTQTMDENGNLVNVALSNTQETRLHNAAETTGEEITPEAISKELFEGEEIVTNTKGKEGKVLPESLRMTLERDIEENKKEKEKEKVL